ncbi:MAG TPA: glycine dehydrogenase, partial [bacterium (Candidatus Stahlbacteria)]|nr:glycine dehydrogenase [Candidatus Stahlbacteria bacterium]
HIRREKATSNICTNEALCALTALIYLSLMGKEGLKEVANHCLAKTSYLAQQIKPVFPHPFFKEITVRLEEPERFLDFALKEGVLAGIALSRFREEWKDYLLIAVTEKRKKSEIDHLIDLLIRYREGDL